MNAFKNMFKSSSNKSDKSKEEEQKKSKESVAAPYADTKTSGQKQNDPSLDSRKSYDLQMEQMKVLGNSGGKGASDFKNAQYSNLNDRQATDESMDRRDQQLVS